MTMSDRDIERRLADWAATLEPPPELFGRIEASVAVDTAHRRARRIATLAAVAAAAAAAVALVVFVGGRQSHRVVGRPPRPPRTPVEWVLGANDACATTYGDAAYHDAEDRLNVIGPTAPAEAQAPLLAAQLPAVTREIRAIHALAAPPGHENTIRAVDERARLVLAGYQAVAAAYHSGNQAKLNRALDTLYRAFDRPFTDRIRADFNNNFRGSCLGQL